jgi:hypothetical protein
MLSGRLSFSSLWTEASFQYMVSVRVRYVCQHNSTTNMVLFWPTNSSSALELSSRFPFLLQSWHDWISDLQWSFAGYPQPVPPGGNIQLPCVSGAVCSIISCLIQLLLLPFECYGYLISSPCRMFILSMLSSDWPISFPGCSVWLSLQVPAKLDVLPSVLVHCSLRLIVLQPASHVAQIAP